MNSMRDYRFEWVIIDNSSTDNSREILRAIASRDERVRVIYNLRNFGPGRSSCHGLFQTSGDAAICMACDLQDPPELIPDYVAKWEQGSDVVLGKIASSEESKRAFATRGLFYKIMASFSDNPIESHVTGFGLYSRRVIELLEAEGNLSQTLDFQFLTLVLVCTSHTSSMINQLGMRGNRVTTL